MRDQRLKIPLRFGIIVLLLTGLAAWLALAPKSPRQILASVQLVHADFEVVP